MSDNLHPSRADDLTGGADDPILLIAWPAIAGPGPRRVAVGLFTVHPSAQAGVGEAALLVTVSPSSATGVVVRVAGELDLAVVDVFSDALERQLAAGRRDVLLDLSELRFCGCSGLAALLAAHHRLAAASGRLTLTGLNDSMLRLLRLTGLDEVLATPPAVSCQGAAGR